jgi:hypothetical protein
MEINHLFKLDKNFSYGYDGGLYNLRQDKNSKFNCYYRKATYNPISFKDECIRVCNEISDYAVSANRIPIVLLSGGCDSEVVVRSFIESGKKFKVVSNRFLNDLNSQEIAYIEKFSKKYNFEVEYVDIDIETWLSGKEALEMADISKCTRPEMLPTMKLMSEVYFKLNGVPVLGNGDFYVSKDINPYDRMNLNIRSYQWNYIEYEYILAWMRYAAKTSIQGSINFFQQTPEIVLSMGNHPLMKELFEKNIVGKQSSRSTKYLVYKEYWNDIELRPKFHGGEKIKNICDFLRKTKLIQYRDYDTKWKLPVNDFLNMLKYND